MTLGSEWKEGALALAAPQPGLPPAGAGGRCREGRNLVEPEAEGESCEGVHGWARGSSRSQERRARSWGWPARCAPFRRAQKLRYGHRCAIGGLAAGSSAANRWSPDTSWTSTVPNSGSRSRWMGPCTMGAAPRIAEHVGSVPARSSSRAPSSFPPLRRGEGRVGGPREPGRLLSTSCPTSRAQTLGLFAKVGLGGHHGAGFTMVLLSRVTAAIRARTRPFSVAPVTSVIAWSAMIVPWKEDVSPSVAEVPSCQ